MKSFRDLKFEPHHFGGLRAKMDFPNTYGVSVVSGPATYTDGPDEYELAIMKDGRIHYESGITKDVLGHLSAEEVTEYMRRAQELPIVAQP